MPVKGNVQLFWDTIDFLSHSVPCEHNHPVPSGLY
jgi:hypothetical protein